MAYRSSDQTAELRDLGFGPTVMQQSALRLLNRDGSFNVSRDGLPFWQSIHLYRTMLETPWWSFILILLGLFLVSNTVFAIMYLLGGPGALVGMTGTTGAERFLSAFFFSVHTITTIGYGHIAPQSLAANVIVTFESFIGLAGFALVAGLIFARFEQPQAKVVFSKQAVVSAHGDTDAFKLRMINGRQNELLDVDVTILLCMTETVGNVRTRRFQQLSLERNEAAFFPLDWTVVHPISKDSPLHGVTEDELRQRDAEFLVLVNATDDTSSQRVHARSSYRWNEVAWNAQFRDMYRQPRHGHMRVDLRRLHDVEEVSARDILRQTLWEM